MIVVEAPAGYEWWQVLILIVVSVGVAASAGMLWHLAVVERKSAAQAQRVATVCRELRALVDDWLEDDGKPIVREE